MGRGLVSFLVMITIFVYSVYFFREPFEGYLSYFVYLLLFPIFFASYGIPSIPLILFIPLLLSGWIYINMDLNSWPLFIKVFIGFFASVVFYDYVMKLYNFDVKVLFKAYMVGCLVCSLIGLFQIFSFQIGFEFGYNLAWYGLNKWQDVKGGLFGLRLNSIFSEPSYFAAVVAPAFFVSLQNLIRKKYIYLNRTSSIIIVIAYICTFSSVGILGVILAVILLLLNFGLIRYAYIFGPIIYATYYFSYNNVEEFRTRWDSTVEIFASDGNVNTYDVHGSSFVLYNNYHIAWENFIRNPLFGTGLGSHPIAFDKYSLTRMDDVIQIDFNKADANSMFLRLMSETGLYGLIIVLGLLFRFFIQKGKSVDDEHWVLSNALCLIIALYLLRQGHYFMNGFPFFLWLYYYNWKSNKELLQQQEAEQKTEKSTPESPAESKPIALPI